MVLEPSILHAIFSKRKSDITLCIFICVSDKLSSPSSTDVKHFRRAIVLKNSIMHRIDRKWQHSEDDWYSFCFICHSMSNFSPSFIWDELNIWEANSCDFLILLFIPNYFLIVIVCNVQQVIFKRSKSYFSQRYLLARKKISGRTDFLNTICKIYEADIDSCLSRIKVDNVLIGKI